MKKIGIFLPGRLQSQRLENKLILPLGDTNLWRIACEKLNNLPEKYGKYVLIDRANELYLIAKQFKNIKIIIRDPDTCIVDGPMGYIFKELEQTKEDYLMFLNPCLYTLTEETIVNALEYFNESEYNSMTSVKPFQNWFYGKASRNGIEVYEPCLLPDTSDWSTKSIKGYWQAAHCFHIFKKENLLKNDIMLEEKHDCFEINPAECLDVDNKLDYEYARYYVGQM